MYWVTLSIAVLLGSLAQIPLKISSQKKYNHLLGYFVNSYTITGYSIMLIAAGLSFISVRHIELKYLPIIESLGYVYVLIIGYLAFNERINIREILASLLIISGVIVFSA